MKSLAEAILLAAKIHEESWDPKTENKMSFHSGAYTISLRKAADIAAEKLGYDTRGSEPIFLLLYCSWDDALAWAKEAIL